MPRYLTPAWFEAAQRALDRSTTLPTATAGVRMVVQQTVTDGPDGDTSYHVVVDDGSVRIVDSAAVDPTVTFIESWDTAGAISRGELSAQGAFMTGLIRVRGDLPALVAQGGAFGEVDDALADLRTQTTY